MVDVTLYDEFGFPQQPNEPISICFEVTSAQTRDKEDLCLGSFSPNTGLWSCDDPCLQQEDNLLCGTVDHLTNFALLLSGGGGKNGNCGSGTFDYIAGSAWADLLLSASCVLFCCFFVMLVVCIRSFKVQTRKREKEQYIIYNAEQ